jgi:hypothetical protein
VFQYLVGSMSIKPVSVYEDNKTYPILVRLNGYNLIIEMLGSVVNEHNRQVRRDEWHQHWFISTTI